MASPPQKPNPSPGDLVPAPAVFLQAEAPLAIDLYVHLPKNQSLLLYRRKGELLSLTETMGLSRARVLVLKTECETALRAMAEQFKDEATEEGTVSPGLQKLGEHLLGEMIGEGVTGEKIRKTLDDSSSLVTEIVTQFQTVKSGNLFQKFIAGLDRSGGPLDIHNRHVSALSVLVFLLAGGVSMEELSDLATSGLVHDLCLAEIPEIFLSRHLSGEDLAMQATKSFFLDTAGRNYRAHIDRVLEKLRVAGVELSPGAVKIIQQHHENIDGSGLYGLRDNQIYRPARILRIVDDLVSLMNRPEEPMTLEEAFKTLHRFNHASYHRLYDEQILRMIGQKIIGAAFLG